MSHVAGGKYDKTRITPPSATHVTDGQRVKARRFVAGRARDRGDCVELLAMLGLEHTEDEIEQRREAS